MIAVERMIKEGDISPLWWGMSAAELGPVLSGHPLDDWGTGRTSRQTLLNVDGVEFYFAARRQQLLMLLIATWRLTPDAVSSCFDFGWLTQNLTLAQMRAQLDQLGWAYELMHDPLNPDHPLLVLGRRVWCWFAGEAATPQLWKITLTAPDSGLDQHGYARLVPVAD